MHAYTFKKIKNGSLFCRAAIANLILRNPILHSIPLKTKCFKSNSHVDPFNTWGHKDRRSYQLLLSFIFSLLTNYYYLWPSDQPNIKTI